MTDSSGDGSIVKDESSPEAIDVSKPAKLMRLGAMTRQMLEELRRAPLDEQGRRLMRELYQRSVNEVQEILSPELKEELTDLSIPFTDDQVPSESELRIAQAQLMGWLEGLFHGIQATLFAQQMEARSQLEEMRRRGLPRPESQTQESRPGQYL